MRWSNIKAEKKTMKGGEKGEKQVKVLRKAK